MREHRLMLLELVARARAFAAVAKVCLERGETDRVRRQLELIEATFVLPEGDPEGQAFINERVRMMREIEGV
jgi:hypothetical protein